MTSLSRGRTIGFAVALAFSLGSVLASGRTEAAVRRVRSDTSSVRLRDVRNAPALIRFVDDSLRGRSGSLYARFVIGGGRSAAMPVFAGLFGDSSVRHPGVYSVEGSALSRPFAFVDVRGARGRWGLSQ